MAELLNQRQKSESLKLPGVANSTQLTASFPGSCRAAACIRDHGDAVETRPDQAQRGEGLEVTERRGGGAAPGPSVSADRPAPSPGLVT